MSNDQVVLQMMANRLVMLMEQFDELKSKYGAEMTELVHLAQGVITEPTEPTPARWDRDQEGRWLLPLTSEELETLWGAFTGGYLNDFPRSIVHELELRTEAIYDHMVEETRQEAGYDDDDDGEDNPIQDDPIEAPEPFIAATGGPSVEQMRNLYQNLDGWRYGGPRYNLGVDLAVPEPPPVEGPLTAADRHVIRRNLQRTIPEMPNEQG